MGDQVRRRSDELAALLARVARQDRAAFAEVYRRTADHLLGVAWSVLRDHPRAEEVLQEAFMNVWYGARGYDPALAAPMTWLINVVRHKAIDLRRSERGELASTVALEDVALPEPGDDVRSPGRLLEQSLARARIEACMATLSAAQRQAIALAYYRGQAHSEIAATLGAPLGTVKAWVRRGLERLGECLQAAGVESS